MATWRFGGLILTTLLLAGCGGATSAPVPAPGPEPPGPRGEVVVFAAASLTDAFKEIGQALQARYPGLSVTFNFAASSTLRAQLRQGARADVFASADERNMRAAQQDGTIAGEPRVFVRNEPVIVVPAANPGGITTLKDLARTGLRLVVAGREVPIGGYTRQIVQNAGQDPAYGPDFADRVLKNLVSEEPNPRASLAKVVLGEADGTFVYRSDITPEVRDRVKVIEIPSQFNVVADYYIAIVQNGPNPAGAATFIDFVFSAEGQNLLARWSFKPVG
jgi:molybdate transport system substrate-binding protein